MQFILLYVLYWRWIKQPQKGSIDLLLNIKLYKDLQLFTLNKKRSVYTWNNSYSWELCHKWSSPATTPSCAWKWRDLNLGTFNDNSKRQKTGYQARISPIPTPCTVTNHPSWYQTVVISDPTQIASNRDGRKNIIFKEQEIFSYFFIKVLQSPTPTQSWCTAIQDYLFSPNMIFEQFS